MSRRKKKYLEGIIEKVNFPNMSEFTFEDKKVNFKGGIEGQKVSVVVGRKREKHMEAKLLEILEKSPLETNTTCPNYLECGGCSYQSVSHEYELKLKQRQIKELFEDVYSEEPEIFESPLKTAYRNKMEYTFADMYKDSPIMLGMHKKNRFYEVVDTKECNLVHSDFEIIRNAIQAAIADPRFLEVTEDELVDIDISVDVLTNPIKAIKEELNPKIYGVIVSKGQNRGLLLPDLEGVDTVEEQLNIACQKGGIDPNSDYSIEKFEVIRYKEGENNEI